MAYLEACLATGSMAGNKKFSGKDEADVCINICMGMRKKALQVEARLRQLEGKVLATGSAALGQKANQAAYDPKINGVSAAIATTSKVYNPAADVPANGDAKVKKEKVLLHTTSASRLYSSGSGSQR